LLQTQRIYYSLKYKIDDILYLNINNICMILWTRLLQQQQQQQQQQHPQQQ
jgi:hypothetical protein